jgi:tetratricopeptide (TPR) repeat protein
MRKSLLLLFCATMLAGRAFAQSTTAMPGMEHPDHHHGPDASEKLGHVSFPTSCAVRSQNPMERGVALLHSFGYTEAQMQFQAIVQDDPACAMAHWGIAMTQFQELWGHPDVAALKLGAAEIARARTLAAAPGASTARERAYIDALSAFFAPAEAPYQQRADAYEAKMNALHRAFPDDVEAAAFDALSMLASVAPNDASLTHEHQALAILVPLYASHPGHPGLAHYIIHTCDTPALAPEGLGAAREYAKIAPSSPHALHMPGHIFARLGMWPEDIDSNLASVAASEKAEAAGEPGSAHQMHADEFLIYAYLQVGEDAKARDLTYRMRAVGEHMSAMPGMDDMKDDGRAFDNELRVIYAAEMHDWQALSEEAPAPGSKPYESLFTYWGQGIAAGHLHNRKLASAALAAFDRDFGTLKDSPLSEFTDALEVKREEVAAWKAFADDQPAAALAAMRKAADRQDKLGQMEVDIPAREMLGDLLLLQRSPEKALVEYRIALKLSPNRLNGLLSAGEAAEQAKQPAEAQSFYAVAARQTDSATHSQRPELAHAVKIAGAM